MKELLTQLKSGSLKITQANHDSAKAVLKGARTVVDIGEEVLEEMSPNDDSPLELTLMEGAVIALGRLGLKMGN